MLDEVIQLDKKYYFQIIRRLKEKMDLQQKRMGVHFIKIANKTRDTKRKV